MQILIIGGTVFLGRVLVEAALAAGHDLTLFNRGRSNTGLFPEIEQVHGDRSENLDLLKNRRWDAVIDTSGYHPDIVRKSAEFLSEAVGNYTFISSISVYQDASQPGIAEDAPVAVLEEMTHEITGESYGPLKALCEQVVESAQPGKALIVRPGLIVGPYDPTDRFTYWPERIARGGEVLVPGRPERGIQIIDVRDLAEWIIRLISGAKTGIYNATGPEKPISMSELVETCRAVSASGARFTWISDEFLLENKVSGWTELPLWLPEMEPESKGLFAADIRKGLQTGLTFRPLSQTIENTLEWVRSRPKDHTWRAGLSPIREAELLNKWKTES